MKYQSTGMGREIKQGQENIRHSRVLIIEIDHYSQNKPSPGRLFVGVNRLGEGHNNVLRHMTNVGGEKVVAVRGEWGFASGLGFLTW